MRMLLVLAALGLLTAVAGAQPGQSPPPPPVYAPPPPPPVYAPPPPPPPGHLPPPHTYQPPPPGGLTAEDAKLLARGEISAGAHIGGGAASLLFGFGLGQAIQGRWSETGWIFTVGETVAVVALFAGIGSQIDDCAFEDSCNSDDGETLIVGGMIGFVVLHVWEVVDAFAGPASHNRKLRELRTRLGYPPVYYGLTPFVAPPRDGAGGVAGVSFRF